MTPNKDKELLMKDICSRLPYSVKIQHSSYQNPLKVLSINPNGETWVIGDKGYPIEVNWEDCKPYLFPMSSMTDEQKKEYTHIVNYIDSNDTENWKEGEFIYVEQFTQLMHFYHRHHLDYRGLIPTGLAIDATGLNIY